ncbi:hypothetical protein CCH79_00005094 [Gambusia affinis]|uniref:Uncharacterized protein n=1 Tax=Gambusia affinis TaxID=33528 RepID=A0A315VP03_GAMAF|nr:hypothetical protein CCH79_00005094 [Gambusia affinis]
MVDFGEILETVGDFGFFQRLLLLALASPHFLLPTYQQISLDVPQETRTRRAPSVFPQNKIVATFIALEVGHFNLDQA